jgi:hypothetical protein
MILGAVLGLGLVLSAEAGPPEAWASLHDARLSQSLDQDPAAAIAIYEAMLSHTPTHDPMRGELLYWLGRARWSAGDAPGAQKTLQSAAATDSGKRRARILLSRMAARGRAMRHVPYRQEFGLDLGPLVRGGEVGEDEDLRWSEGPGGRVAEWTTEVVAGVEDTVIAAFDTDGERVRRIRVRIYAEIFPAHIRILVEDDRGGSWTAPVVVVEAGRWQVIDVPLSGFVNAEAPAAQGSPNGKRLKWLTIRDVTAAHSEDRGPRRLMIDDLELR